MKVRVGVGFGPTVFASRDEFATTIGTLDESGLDSLWLSEVLTAPVIDPIVGMAVATGMAPRLKVGTTFVLPGRNLVRTAKELATLDRLSNGRLLITAVAGLRQPGELAALGVTARERGMALDEAVPLLRRLWAGERVTHRGEIYDLQDVAVEPRPVQDPLEVWVGGMVPAALRRTALVADGWLPALCTTAEADAGRRVIDQISQEAGRAIDPEHFGVSIGYSDAAIDADQLAGLARRRPDLEDPAVLVPVGLDALRRQISEFVDVGFSKFVVRPMVTPPDWPAEIRRLADALGDLQT
ncbi:MAG: LLM class flavin-dependent oxidoreductase [Acidimicrobiales bacterium]